MRTLKGAGVSELLGKFYKGLRKRTRSVSHYFSKRNNPEKYNEKYYPDGTKRLVLNDNNQSQRKNDAEVNFETCFEHQIERVQNSIKRNSNKIIWVKNGDQWYKFNNPSIIVSGPDNDKKYIIDDNYNQLIKNSGKQLGKSCNEYVLTDEEFKNLGYEENLFPYTKSYVPKSRKNSTNPNILDNDSNNEESETVNGGKSRHRKIKKRKSANKTRRR